ncbi:hypothetical protein ID866_1888 [Astraeus odoratus]|nr:hypothetical protein ID866_1888 [Astraeus odoratus]
MGQGKPGACADSTAPYYYPIVGRKNTGGSFDRIPIEDMQKNHPYQFSLFVLGYAAIQGVHNPNIGIAVPTVDLPAVTFMEIAGIHGKPYKEYAGDRKTQAERAGDYSETDPKDTLPVPSRFGGYCNHSSVTFTTWHRPYMLLIEQAIGNVADRIAADIEKTNPAEKGKWVPEAKKFRFPYWDWADPGVQKEGFPSVFYSDTLDILVPGGKTASVSNPFSYYTYQGGIPSDFTNEVNAQSGELGYFSVWPRSYRHPPSTPAGGSDIAAVQRFVDFTFNVLDYWLIVFQSSFSSQMATLSSRIGLLFTFPSGMDPAIAYDQFSNALNESRRLEDFQNVGSLEAIHGLIHGITGGNGHMSQPDYAAFDPFFFFHHSSVDRLLALWEWCYKDYWMGDGYTYDGQSYPWTQERGTFGQVYNEQLLPSGANGALYPFRLENGEYWTSDQTRFLDASAYPKYYSYQEFLGIKVDKDATDDERLAARATIAKYYGFDPQTAATQVDAAAWSHIPVTPASEAGLPSTLQEIPNFRVFMAVVQLPEHSFNRSYTLDLHYNQGTESQLLGSVAVFARSDLSPCKACAKRRSAASVVRGVIPLPSSIVNEIILKSTTANPTLETTTGDIAASLSGKLADASRLVLATAQGGTNAPRVPPGNAAPGKVIPIETTLYSTAVAEKKGDPSYPVQLAVGRLPQLLDGSAYVTKRRIQDDSMAMGSTLEDVIDKLQEPIIDAQSLLRLLCLPLEAARLLPPQFRRFNPLLRVNTETTIDIDKVFPVLQRILLETILPTWEVILEEEGCTPLVQQYFCPDAFLSASATAGVVALCAYSTILALPMHPRSVELLLRLVKEYPIDRLYATILAVPDAAQRSVEWGDCLQNIFAVPNKVANAFAGRDMPSQLAMPDYLNDLSLRSEYLLHCLSKTFGPADLFVKLVNVGAFPSLVNLSPSQPSFFRSTMPLIRRRLHGEYGSPEAYKKLWNTLMFSLPSVLTQQSIVTSLFSSLTVLDRPLGTTAFDRGIISKEALLLHDVLGEMSPDMDSWNIIIAAILNRTWNPNHARVFVCWLAKSKHMQALEKFISSIVNVWSTPDHIKYSLLSQHHYVSILLLMSITYFPPSSPPVMNIALSPSFISAIVAEMVASQAGKRLDFGDWDGHEHGKDWARQTRQLCSQRDVDFEPQCNDQPISHPLEGLSQNDVVQEAAAKATRLHSNVEGHGYPGAPKGVSLAEIDYDSDDSLVGYASPPSTRSPSPTESELADIEKDPTLRVGVKKIPRLVYLSQLGELVRGTSGLGSNEENQEAQKIEMAINVGEDLVRRKRDYGSELAENAVNLVYGFIALNNNYDLQDFDDKRQRIIVALIACCPRTAAPCIIEEFFKNQYSTEQRIVMMNGLALAARELASLPSYPPSAQPLVKPSFPSKMLPPALHQKYLTTGTQNNIQLLLDGITRDAVDSAREPASDKMPEFVRERQLRIRKPPRVSEVGQQPNKGLVPSQHYPSSTVLYTEVAAEYFIMPYISRFWAFLRDEQIREERTAQRDVLYQYRGAGTGLILNPVVLSHFLGTMAILVHAARNAAQWLAIIAPEALELAVTLGSRQISIALGSPPGQSNTEQVKNEASVLTSALELTLVVLDGSLELDGGRSLSLEHGSLLLGVGEWAGEIFRLLDKGSHVEGGGGEHEVKLDALFVHRDTEYNNPKIPFGFSSENMRTAEDIISRYPPQYKKAAVIPLLHLAQHQNKGWTSISVMNYVAKLLEMPPMRVYEVATFYTMFNREPIGENFVQVCTTTPCGLKPGETTKDGKFTVIEVECQGACSNAPMMVINNDFYEDLTPETTKRVLDAFAKGVKPNPGPQSGRHTSENSAGLTALTSKPYGPGEFCSPEFQ